MSIEALQTYITDQQEERQAMIVFSEENPLIYVLVANCEKKNCTVYFLSQYFVKYNRTALFTIFVYEDGRQTFYTVINPDVGRQNNQSKVAEVLYDYAVMNIDLNVLIDSVIHDNVEMYDQIMLNPAIQRMFNTINVLTN